MTFSTLASPGVSLQGGGGSGGGGGGTPGGSDTQIQYNSSGTFAGASGLTTNGTELTIASGTKTADAPVLNMSQTWNNGAVTFTGLKFNAAGTSDANSASASLLMDLQVNTASKFKVQKDGGIILADVASQFVFGGSTATMGRTSGQAIGFGIGGNPRAQVNGSDGEFRCISTGSYSFSSHPSNVIAAATDTILTRRAAANLRLGAADAAAPVAQTLSVQSITGTNASAAAYPFKITGAQGTGNAAGGSIIFQVAPAGGSGAVQNTPVDALTIDSTKLATFGGNVTLGGTGLITGITTGASKITLDDATGAQMAYGNVVLINGGNIYLSTGGTPRFSVRSGGEVRLDQLSAIGWSGTLNNTNAALDVSLYRDAANTLALRNGNEGQTFRLYGRFTDITNDFERFFINAPTTSGAAVLLGTQKGATTGAARALAFQTDGTTRLTIPSNGGVWTTSGEYFHFRASANTSASVISPADGVMTLGNWSADNFNRLQFGGTSSFFPALKRVSANLQVIAADGTSSAGLIVGNQALSTTATDGFLYVPTCAGTPTGTPTAQTGTVPIVVDTTNNKLYFYSNAAWRDAGP